MWQHEQKEQYVLPVGAPLVGRCNVKAVVCCDILRQLLPPAVCKVRAASTPLRRRLLSKKPGRRPNKLRRSWPAVAARNGVLQQLSGPIAKADARRFFVRFARPLEAGGGPVPRGSSWVWNADCCSMLDYKMCTCNRTFCQGRSKKPGEADTSPCTGKPNQDGPGKWIHQVQKTCPF